MRYMRIYPKRDIYYYESNYKDQWNNISNMGYIIIIITTNILEKAYAAF